MNNIVLVWITNPSACGNIVRAGKKISNELNAELMIASIQKAIRNDWDSTVNDLEALSNASRSVNAELTVIYSDNIFESAVKTVRNVNPLAMVAGVPGDRNKNLFLEQLQSCSDNVPIYTVDTHGNVLKLG